MDTVRSFKGLNIGPIQSYLSKCDKPFETSPLYSSETEETYVDTDRRKSVYRTIVDPTLFGLVENLMAVINDGDNEYQYVLWKNGYLFSIPKMIHQSDITHIKYEEGGFFKRHRDFNSTTSNLIEEFSLIVCVTPEEEVAKGVEGGETSIVTFGGVDSKPVEKIFDTKTPGCALLFRKDLNHEGKKLINGVKHIITANIFAVKKTQSEQVLYVTFPEEGEELVDDVDGKDSATTKAAIQRVANDSRSYVLPVSHLQGVLEAHVRFTNAQVEADGNDPPQVVPFVCHDYTYEQFGVVAKVLSRCYVDEDSIKNAHDCLNYFGPFRLENLLVDLALEPRVDKDDAEPPEKKQKEESSGSGDSDMSEDSDFFDADVIVCENEARMKVVLQTARQFDQPYVPFKILFIEGMLQYFDGDGDGVGDAFDVPMTAAAAFVGDHNNVFALWCLDQYGPTEPFTLESAHNCTPFFYCAPEDHTERLLNLDLGAKCELFCPPPEAEYASWEMHFKVTYDVEGEGRKKKKIETEEFLREGMGLGLNVRVSNSELKSGLLKYMFSKYERSDVKPLDLSAGLTKESDVIQPVNSLFHYDGNGKACFTLEQAELASDYIASMNLEEKVKASLNKKKFELPQVSENVSMVYCNDDRYGKMNVLWVCGVMRLEENVESPAEVVKQEEFDAWPSEEGKAKIEHAKRLGSKYAEICSFHGELPPEWWEYDSDESSELRFDDDSNDESD